MSPAVGCGLCALALLSACEEAGPKPAPVASATAATSVAPPLPGPAAAASRQAPAPGAQPSCRALRVVGAAKLGDAALTSDALLDGRDWVSLGPGARLTLKHTTSSRELSVVGPARFRACYRGREQLVLSRGTVTSTAGAGARPGAEVLLGTPIGVVRYADAELTLTLDEVRLSVAVRAGSVDVEPLPRPSAPIKSPLSARERLVLPLGKPDASKAIAACKSAAEQARASAQSLVDRSGGDQLSERAKQHVRARKSARSSCAVAAAATGLVADPAASAGLWAEVVKWDGLWESIPRRAPAPEK